MGSKFGRAGVSDRGRSRLLLACEGSRWIPRRVDQGRGGPQWERRRRHRQVGIGLGRARLKAARERRLRLDPDQLAREQRIDEAAVDVEVAWEARAAGRAGGRGRGGRGRGRDRAAPGGAARGQGRGAADRARPGDGASAASARDRHQTTASAPLLRVPTPRWRDGEPADRRDQPPTAARAAAVVVGLAADLDPDRPGRGRPGA